MRMADRGCSWYSWGARGCSGSPLQAAPRLGWTKLKSAKQGFGSIVYVRFSRSRKRAFFTRNKDPPPLGSGVLDHLNGRTFPAPFALGALLGHSPDINPFEPNSPNLDPFELNDSFLSIILVDFGSTELNRVAIS